jgi:hypothetical protein
MWSRCAKRKSAYSCQSGGVVTQQLVCLLIVFHTTEWFLRTSAATVMHCLESLHPRMWHVYTSERIPETSYVSEGNSDYQMCNMFSFKQKTFNFSSWVMEKWISGQWLYIGSAVSNFNRKWWRKCNVHLNFPSRWCCCVIWLVGAV